MIFNPVVTVEGGGSAKTCTGIIHAVPKFPGEVVYSDGEAGYSFGGIIEDTEISVLVNSVLYVNYAGAGGLSLSGGAQNVNGEMFNIFVSGDFEVSSA